MDNDMRRYFFGQEASTSRNRERFRSALGARHEHHNVDIQNTVSIDNIFSEYGSNIELIIYTAAKPSQWGPLSCSIACFSNPGVCGDDICCRNPLT
jgi:hypothetical protein